MWSVIRKKQNKKGEEGFTLIELIVVIAILGFLLALAIPRYTSSRLEAAKKSTQANLHNLANAVELYMTEIPTTTVPAYDSGIFSKYIPKAPKPPVGTNAYKYYAVDSDSYCIWDPNQIGSSYFYVTEGGIITDSESLPYDDSTGSKLNDW
jgi:type IV pilus assembly protein PilA